MATKHAGKKNSGGGGMEQTGAAAGQARAAAKPATARVTSVKHSKAAMMETAVEVPVAQKTSPVVVENQHAAIAKIAYGFWAARGFQGGQPSDDWFRAEAEFRQQPR